MAQEQGLREDVRGLLNAAAEAVAELESTQRLLPFLDPKHLNKVARNREY